MHKDNATPTDTNRLAFREWRSGDVVPFHVICSDPQVMQFVGDGGVWSIERTEQFIGDAADMARNHGYCQWPLLYKPDGKMIGYCGLVKAADGIEIGWRLAPGYWGQGLATEAARCVLSHGFEKLGCHQVRATVQAANVASIRVIEKLGMTRIHRFERDGRHVFAYVATANPPTG